MAYEISKKLKKLPEGSTVLVRRPRQSKMNTFERWVVELCDALDIPVRFCTPDSNDRSAVFRRDYEMVEAADYVEAYFSPDRIMEGGTGHVVEAALSREKAVYAWVFTNRGVAERVGEIDKVP